MPGLAEFVPLCAVAVVSFADEEGFDGELVDEVGGEEHDCWEARGLLVLWNFTRFCSGLVGRYEMMRLVFRTQGDMRSTQMINRHGWHTSYLG